jgi:hypothetical protein
MCDMQFRQVLGGSNMQQHSGCRWIVVVLLLVPLLVAACGGSTGEEAFEQHAVAEKVEGGKLIRVVLTEDAAKRLDIRTAPVRNDGGRTVIPYAAVLYDPTGETWTYTNPEHLVFVRKDISVRRIEGNRAFLRAGPSVGTPVVTVGATELWGVEYGGIEED